MMRTSKFMLKILAALIWYAGGLILLLKGGSLLIEAETLSSGQYWLWLAALSGLILGSIKAKYIFVKICSKNLIRIEKLKEPKIWQFYRPGFFLFLALMIALGATLSGLAHGNYPFLIAVAILDFSIATALLGSSYVFWERKTSEKYDEVY